MKLHKLISRTVLTTALLGVAFGGAFSGIKAHANDENDTKGDSNQADMSRKLRSNSSNNNDTTTTNTQVKDGFLTLDSVPTLSFGSDQNNKSNSTDQPATFNLNSQNNGTLRITDYRNIDKKSYSGSDSTNQGKNNGQSGWALSAKMSNFTNTNNNYKGNPLDTNNWTMHLNNNSDSYQNLDVNNGNVDASKANFNAQTLYPNEPNSGNLLDSTNPSNGNGKGYGVNEINYNNSNAASLDIPNVPQGTYTADVTWSLSTPLNSYNTNSDNE